MHSSKVSQNALVDELTRGVKSALHDDHNLLYPALEDQFAAAAPN
jgi:hypothetical protein